MREEANATTDSEKALFVNPLLYVGRRHDWCVPGDLESREAMGGSQALTDEPREHLSECFARSVG